MHVLQRTSCVILISLSLLTRVSPIPLKEPMNTTVNDDFRHPTFTDNISRGINRAKAISGTPSTIPIIEVRNTTPLWPEGSTTLNDFRTMSMDLILMAGPMVPYGSQRATISGSARSWGTWGTSLVDFRHVDAETANRAFERDQIVMDEDEAHDILRMKGFMGPWECIYLCKLLHFGMLFYIFQEPRQMGSLQTIYQFVGVEDGRVRLFHGEILHPCTPLSLDLTMNATFQADPANRTNLQVSPSGPTNVTSQKVFEVEGVLSESITAF